MEYHLAHTNPNNIKLKKILTSKEEEQIHIKRLQQMEESSGVKPNRIR